MFTNAGMNQFKDIFLNNKNSKYKKATNNQPCLRISGKHNDLEEVGIDTYHHTMFEMLGNWSFGDYFKKYAIKLAWELITKIYKICKKKLYITVFAGDINENISFDINTYNIWKNYLLKSKIIFKSKVENFWEMSTIGPCGPCSEIYIDSRNRFEKKIILGTKLINIENPFIIELWNLVFIKYNRLKNKKLEKLLNKHIDTGMGLERLAMVMQNKKSTYDTDIFKPIINCISNNSNKIYGKNKKIDIAIRVIADHVRSISFVISEGKIPDNNKSGYVIKKILRRAVRYGYTYLGFQKPFIYKLIHSFTDKFKDIFFNLNSQKLFIEKIVKSEEISFFKSLKSGILKLENIININKSKNNHFKVISGKLVFDLYDTYGFPADLTKLIARENNLSIDSKSFDEYMNDQKNTSKSNFIINKSDWIIIIENLKSYFAGYDYFSLILKIVKYRTIEKNNNIIYQLVFDKTPFYPEGGGQAGDIGYIQHNDEIINIINTQKENNLIIHYVNQLPKNLTKKFKGVINIKNRFLISNNHSATHILQSTLKKILGSHIEQKGSFINEKLLRFDFLHYKSLTKLELEKIENLVNNKIKKNILIKEYRSIDIEKAKKMNALSFFKEKYKKFVRVISFDKNFSLELCSGTHICESNNIKFFKIISSNSIASGIKRIESITSNIAENYINNKLILIDKILKLTKYSQNIEKFISSMIKENSLIRKKILIQQKKKTQNTLNSIKSKIRNINKFNFLIEKLNLSNIEIIKKAALRLKSKYELFFLTFGIEVNKIPFIIIILSSDIIKILKKNAKDLMEIFSLLINGKKSSQNYFAILEGEDKNKLNKILILAIKIFYNKILV